MIFPKVISAGQTGAEREALQFAVENDLGFGGWCPKGRRAEDGRIAEDYGLHEANSEDLTECVEANVLLANGTVVFTLAPKLGHRARLPVKMAQKHQRPWLHLHRKTKLPALVLASLISYNRMRRLHVSGSWASEEPAIGQFVRQILDQTLAFVSDG